MNKCNKKSETPSLKKNFFLSTLYELLCVLTPIITAPYISRVLGAVNVGIYSYTAANQMFFSIFGALGTASYGAREIARNRDNIAERTKLFWEIELLCASTCFISLIAWGIFILITTEYKIYYLVLTGCLFETVFNISWFFKGIEQFKHIVTRNSLVKIIGVTLLFIFVKDENDLIIYLCFQVFIQLFGTITMWFSLPKFICKINKKELHVFRHLKETFVYFIPTIATSIYTILDKTLIGAITKEPAQNGYYEQANRIIKIIKTFTATSLNSVMGVRIAYLFKENKINEIKDKISNSIDFILFMGVGCCFGVAGIAQRFVPFFFGPGFEAVIKLLLITAPLILIVSVSNCLGEQYFNPSGNQKLSAKILVFGALINFILNLIFIPKFKSYGAAFASVIAESIICILYMIYGKNYFSFKRFFYQSYKKLIAGLIMMCFIFFIGTRVDNNFLCLFLQIFLGFAIYVLLLLLMKDSFMYSFIIPKVKNRIGTK